MDESDEGLTYKQYEQYRTVSEQLESESNGDTQGVTIEDIGPEDEESDCKDTQSNEQMNGSWILNLIDLSGNRRLARKIQQDAKDMLKRNAQVFSKDDMDMGRTKLVKHHIKLTDPALLKKHIGEYHHKCMMK